MFLSVISLEFIPEMERKQQQIFVLHCVRDLNMSEHHIHEVPRVHNVPLSE